MCATRACSAHLERTASFPHRSLDNWTVFECLLPKDFWPNRAIASLHGLPFDPLYNECDYRMMATALTAKPWTRQPHGTVRTETSETPTGNARSLETEPSTVKLGATQKMLAGCYFRGMGSNDKISLTPAGEQQAVRLYRATHHDPDLAHIGAADIALGELDVRIRSLQKKYVMLSTKLIEVRQSLRLIKGEMHKHEIPFEQLPVKTREGLVKLERDNRLMTKRLNIMSVDSARFKNRSGEIRSGTYSTRAVMHAKIVRSYAGSLCKNMGGVFGGLNSVLGSA